MNKSGYFLILWFMALACDRNHKPVISDITCIPDSRNAGTIFMLKAFASDEDGDLLTYLWKAGEGSFTTPTSSREVQWKSPVTGAGKTCTITVFVTDGEKEVSRSVQITLGQPELGNVKGQVNYTHFRIPITGVTVTIGGQTATSDADGRFQLSGIPAIEDTLFAGKLDFPTIKTVVKVQANDTITVNIEMTSVNFTTKVSGTVKDQDGLLLQNAKLTALNPDGSLSKLNATTDESGFFRLWYIPFGLRTIVVSKEETDDCSYATLTLQVNLNDLQLQLTPVLQKTSFSGTFTDSRDQHVYGFKKIGSQYWMTENLAYLPEVSPSTDLSSWEPRYYVYGYAGTDTAGAISTEKYGQYGVLYNWAASATACPPGWRVPSMLDWDDLNYFLEPGAVKKMKSVSNWNGHGGGTNSSGLNISPAGQVRITRVFSDLGDGAYLWTSTVWSDLKPGFEGFRFDSDNMNYNKGSVMMGCSVRCVK